MKKILLSAAILGSFGLYVLWQNQGNTVANYVATQPATLPKNNLTKTVTNTVPSTNPLAVKTVPKPTPIPTPKPAPAPAPKKGLYTDGSYTGISADAYYGNVQVRAIISNGKLVDVQFLDYPQDRSTSRRINSQAMPLLTQEAIQAQSANVNGVSGASDTSAAFQQSLSSALAQARA